MLDNIKKPWKKFHGFHLDVSVQLERLDQDDITTLKFIHVVVTDISRNYFILYFEF